MIILQVKIRLKHRTNKEQISNYMIYINIKQLLIY